MLQKMAHLFYILNVFYYYIKWNLQFNKKHLKKTTYYYKIHSNHVIQNLQADKKDGALHVVCKSLKDYLKKTPDSHKNN